MAEEQIGALDEDFPSSIPFFPPITEKTINLYQRFYAITVAAIIAFGGIIAPVLEVHLGIGGEPAFRFYWQSCLGRHLIPHPTPLVPGGWNIVAWLQQQKQLWSRPGCWPLCPRLGLERHERQLCSFPWRGHCALLSTLPPACCCTTFHAPHHCSPLPSLSSLPTTTHAGASYNDFIRGMHLPTQLAQVDPIVASFCGGGVGVLTALLIVEINNAKMQVRAWVWMWLLNYRSLGCCRFVLCCTALMGISCALQHDTLAAVSGSRVKVSLQGHPSAVEPAAKWHPAPHVPTWLAPALPPPCIMCRRRSGAASTARAPAT